MATSVFQKIYDSLKKKEKRHLVVANGIDIHSIEAAYRAQCEGFVTVTITGERNFFKSQCIDAHIPLSAIHFIHCNSEDDAIRKAVDLVHNNDADLIMKGLVSTDRFMKEILNKETGLINVGTLLSHITLIDNSNYRKPLLVSDVAIIPQPTLEQKVTMTGYLIDVAHKLGIELPKVAFIAATEKIIPGMVATVDAGKLTQMWKQGRFPGSVCDGPMALDLAIDKESAVIKNFDSPVAGDADCLLFPNIESGNVFYKTNTKICNAQIAAVVIGTTVPVILSSRGDNMDTKLNSIALASLIG